LKTNQKKKPGAAGRRVLRVLSGILASCTLLVASQPAEATTVAGESTTILRMRESTLGDNMFPLYEYLHLYASDTGKRGATSFQLGGWGRVDLGDRSHDERVDGDIQYGFLSYQANRNNLQVNAGRQFVVEGVATERLDGLYMRTDLAAGLTGALYVGSPVTTESHGWNTRLPGGEAIYGGRIAHSIPSLYTIGLSALRNEENGDGLREEEGIDLWLRPLPMLDLAGRSTYNSLSSGWAEHAYTMTISAMEMLRVSGSFQMVNYDDYFYHVTTSALSIANPLDPADDDRLLRPGEELYKYGGSVNVKLGKNIGITGEYLRFDYDLAGSANYYGAIAGFATPNAFTAGLSYHRMDGDGDRMSYHQMRAWGSQKLGPVDVTLDLFDLYFDDEINGRRNTYSLSAAAGYDFTPSLRVAADAEYLRSIDFDHELRGLVKVSYAFGLGKEGR
jgi:hypothetical protein